MTIIVAPDLDPDRLSFRLFRGGIITARYFFGEAADKIKGIIDLMTGMPGHPAKAVTDHGDLYE